MRFLFRLFIILLVIAVAVGLAGGFFGVHFANFDYWDYHGILFLICIAFFPRLTLLFSSVPTGGVLWWLSWLFAPRLLVAVLATVTYWSQNPILVGMAWLVAIGGESSEKHIFVQRTPWRESAKGYDSAKWVKSD
ncbi:MAG: hypothetical protein P4M08_07240 [Oligoflexia bacterium]|nr:hypothetical protein [Oligoflexia bacterium]